MSIYELHACENKRWQYLGVFKTKQDAQRYIEDLSEFLVEEIPYNIIKIKPHKWPDKNIFQTIVSWFTKREKDLSDFMNERLAKLDR